MTLKETQKSKITTNTGGEKVKKFLDDEKILASLIAGGSVRKASQIAGVSISTVRNRLSDSEFRARYESEKAQILQATVDELTACLRDAIPAAQRCLIAGYSLAGLFALYSLCRTDRFNAAVSCSGSLWYPGFADYFCAHVPLRKPKNVYLSLGDREPLTRNPVMQTVGACTQRIADHLSARGIDCVFAWNPGNHFQEPEARLGRGIAWSVERMRQ